MLRNLTLFCLFSVLFPVYVSLASDNLLVEDRLKSCEPSIAVAAAEEVVNNPDTLKEPLLLFPASAALFQHGKKDDAVFWFYAAQLRVRYQLVFEKGDRGQLLSVMIMTVGPPINNYALQDIAKLNQILDRVLKWDERTPNPFKEKARLENINKQIEQVYAGLRDFKAKLTAEKDDLERKARLAAPEIERMNIQNHNSLCREGQFDKKIAGRLSCQMATTSAEKKICTDPELYGLDEKLTDAYQHAYEVMAEKDVIKGSQWRWLEEIRESCRDEKYLKAAYQARVDLLGQIRPERNPADSTANVNLLIKYKPAGPEGKIEIHDYPSTDSRLDYAGNDLIIRIHATATGKIIIPGLKLDNIYQIVQDRFAFNDRTLCTSDLITKGFDLEGVAKSEIILGTNATDRITGHAGNDTLNAGDGDDSYYYRPGDGLDCISDSSGSDTIELTNGLQAKHVAVLVSARNNRSVAQLRLLDDNGRIQTDNGIDVLLDDIGNSPIEMIRFSDGQPRHLRQRRHRTRHRHRRRR